MNCQNCQKSEASVHVTDISGHGTPQKQVQLRHLCEPCARNLELVVSSNVLKVWKLLRQSADRARAEGGLSCPECGMSLGEFRSKGRFGCARDYEVFRAHIEPLLLRVHNAKAHRGRLPGVDGAELERRQHLTDLRSKLEVAIRDEAYESAARIRDAIQELEGQARAH